MYIINCIYVCIYECVYVYSTYIYIYMYIHVYYVYVYIYNLHYVCKYIYIYIDIHFTCKLAPKSPKCQGQRTHTHTLDSESFLQKRMQMDSENNMMRFSNLCDRTWKLIQIQKLLCMFWVWGKIFYNLSHRKCCFRRHISKYHCTSFGI